MTKETFAAVPCRCGHRACYSWHVDGVAAVQGVRFTESQAKLVAAVLTYAGEDGKEEDWAALFEHMTKERQNEQPSPEALQ